MSHGEQLQLDGIEANLAAATAVHRTYRDHAEAVLAQLIRNKTTFSAQDVHERMPAGLEPHSPNVLPSLIRVRAGRGEIEAIGWVRSARPSRHASVNRVWRAAA